MASILKYYQPAVSLQSSAASSKLPDPNGLPTNSFLHSHSVQIMAELMFTGKLLTNNSIIHINKYLGYPLKMCTCELTYAPTY